MIRMEEVASGLRFPEGPVAMEDGSVILVEIARGTLSRVGRDGRIDVIARPGGGPNGAAMGPDGAVYICNNGGGHFHDVNGLLIPGDRSADYSGGRIERVEPESGRIDVLYTGVDGVPFNAPNDLVFDRQGGFWFTDLGHAHGRLQDRGAVYYAKSDGSMVKEVIFPIEPPNGIGLSPDEKTLYVATTQAGRLWAFDIAAPGETGPKGPPPYGGRCVASPDGLNFFDSLAVDGEGNICVATIFNGGITSVSPDGKNVEHFATDDYITTNICFGGEDLRTAFITLSSSGRLVRCRWPRPGLALNFHQK